VESNPAQIDEFASAIKNKKFYVPVAPGQARVPTAEDAMGWPHFLEGGRTAVKTTGENPGYLLNPTGEFVIPGGMSPPAGTMIFRIGPNGERILERSW